VKLDETVRNDRGSPKTPVLRASDGLRVFHAVLGCFCIREVRILSLRPFHGRSVNEARIEADGERGDSPST
jgi:hypothetical protein